MLDKVLGKDPVMASLTRALDAEALRQRVIANNIANLNTPGFKRSRVNFQAFMDAAVQADASGHLKRTDARHIPGRLGGGGPPGVEQVRETSQRADSNNVDLDREMLEMVENVLAFQTISQLRSKKSGIYSLVIRGGR
jgi:flagellar basal-body rod protein FlgB